uniref:Endonuclease 8-like 3 n=1 Tax=Nicotiana sylvestris TaxID=4096 RepID=A0A1U7VL32_NICSY|nr:PREDICTED: endonuclease 8-like 3 [Nicotiana sylvestris]
MSFSEKSRRRMYGCEVVALHLTSRTEMNPGRRFFRCHKPDKTGCGYWEWEDDEFPPRAIIVINKLKREKDALFKERLGNMGKNYFLCVWVSLLDLWLVSYFEGRLENMVVITYGYFSCII